MDGWLTLEEFVDSLGGRFSATAIGNMARAGLFGDDVSRVGKRRYFRVGAMERLLERRAGKGA